MKTMEILLLVFLAIVAYTYLGYGIIVFLINQIKALFGKRKSPPPDFYPEVTLLIAAYNEKDNVEMKVKNSFALNYPAKKIQHVWITDGSDDGTEKALKTHKNVKVLHKKERKGKTGAINRAMSLINTPFVVLCDANTKLNKNAIRNLMRHFADPRVGCVAGEKRIYSKASDSASGSGEGLYWKYESFLKRQDAKLYSAVGAAGELFAIRTRLFEELRHDIILDDFIISMKMAQKGYRIEYEPDAYAEETASVNVKEEMKRKIRIAAGAFQAIKMLTPLLNILKYKTLSFQYISHRLLRWTITPLLLPIIFVLNMLIIMQTESGPYGIFESLFYGQLIFYAMVLVGKYLENRSIRLKLIFVAYYFFIMNYSMIQGFFRYIQKKQNVSWVRAQRAPTTS